MNSNRQPGNHPKKQGGGIIAALVLLCLIIIVLFGYLLVKRPSEKLQPVSPQLQLSPTVKTPDQAPKIVTPAPKESVHEKTIPYPKETTAIPAPKPGTGKQPAGKGHLAIIIDDMGTKIEEARALRSIGVPLTFSIIPGLRSFREVAAFAASNGIETMIHIPMQSKGWPQRRLEANGLLLSMDDASVKDHLEEFIRGLPKAVGANNHMGSEYTEHGDKMKVVLEVLKANNLFFIDSVTTPQSSALRLAREMGIRSGRRNVFLDNEQNQTYIQGQLDQAVRIARKTGMAISICHPHPTTIKTLTELLPGLAKQGITLVPVSELVR